MTLQCFSTILARWKVCDQLLTQTLMQVSANTAGIVFQTQPGAHAEAELSILHPFQERAGLHSRGAEKWDVQ